jgi:allophanate hydrolase subunit 2
MSLAVEFVGPGVTVQDRGRVGSMHLGVPRGGPLDADLFERVRSSLGNAPEAAALEIPWHRARFRALSALVVSVDGEVRTLAAGEVLEVPAAPYAVRYLGLPGGIAAPVSLGGRGTLLVASLGGLDGRMLRRGDVLHADILPRSAPTTPSPRAPSSHTLAVHPLDDAPAACLDALLHREFTVRPQVDRVGMRLAGEMPAGSSGHGASTPLVRGAIEVTPDGGLIVMGPDHPTTGGYPVVAVVARASQGALAQHRPGATVRFTRA